MLLRASSHSALLASLPAAEASDESLLAQRILLDGEYLLTQRLGGGAWGNVFLASHLDTGETVAVKTVPPGAPDAQGERLRAEAELSLRLAIAGRHEYVVGAREFRFDGQRPLLFLDLAHESLQGRLERRSQNPPAVTWMLRCLLEVAAGMRFLVDRRGSASGELRRHGDLHVGNVLLTYDGHAALADLGHSTDVSTTETGAGAIDDFAGFAIIVRKLIAWLAAPPTGTSLFHMRAGLPVSVRRHLEPLLRRQTYEGRSWDDILALLGVVWQNLTGHEFAAPGRRDATPAELARAWVSLARLGCNEAGPQLAALARTAVGSVEITTLRGELAEIATQDDQARAFYDEALQLDPGYSVARRRRWALNERTGRCEAAIEDLLALCVATPTNGVLVARLAALAEAHDAGDIVDDLYAWASGAALPPAGLPISSASVAHTSPRIERLRALFRRPPCPHDNPSVVASRIGALIQSQLSPGSQRWADAIGLYSMADRLSFVGKPKEALVLFEQVIERNPDFAPAWAGVARCASAAAASSKKELDRTIAAVKRALDLDHSLDTLRAMVAVLFNVGAYDDSLKLLDRGVAAYPNSNLRLMRASMRLDLNCPVGVRTDLEEALRLDPSDHECLRVMGRVHQHEGNYVAAERVLRHAVSQLDDPMTLDDLAQLCDIRARQLVGAPAAAKRAEAARLRHRSCTKYGLNTMNWLWLARDASARGELDHAVLLLAEAAGACEFLREGIGKLVDREIGDGEYVAAAVDLAAGLAVGGHPEQALRMLEELPDEDPECALVRAISEAFYGDQAALENTCEALPDQPQLAAATTVAELVGALSEAGPGRTWRAAIEHERRAAPLDDTSPDGLAGLVARYEDCDGSLAWRSTQRTRILRSSGLRGAVSHRHRGGEGARRVHLFAHLVDRYSEWGGTDAPEPLDDSPGRISFLPVFIAATGLRDVAFGRFAWFVSSATHPTSLMALISP